MKYATSCISFYAYWWWDFCRVLCSLVVSETCLCTSCTDKILNLKSTFFFFYFSVGLVGNFAGLPPCTLPSAIVHCNQNETGCCFTNVSWALQNILSKFVYCRNRNLYENFKLTLCTCARSMALGTRAKCQLEILTINRCFSAKLQ